MTSTLWSALAPSYSGWDNRLAALCGCTGHASALLPDYSDLLSARAVVERNAEIPNHVVIMWPTRGIFALMGEHTSYIGLSVPAHYRGTSIPHSFFSTHFLPNPYNGAVISVTRQVVDLGGELASVDNLEWVLPHGVLLTYRAGADPYHDRVWTAARVQQQRGGGIHNRNAMRGPRAGVIVVPMSDDGFGSDSEDEDEDGGNTKKYALYRSIEVKIATSTVVSRHRLLTETPSKKRKILDFDDDGLDEPIVLSRVPGTVLGRVEATDVYAVQRDETGPLPVDSVAIAVPYLPSQLPMEQEPMAVVVVSSNENDDTTSISEQLNDLFIEEELRLTFAEEDGIDRDQGQIINSGIRDSIRLSVGDMASMMRSAVTEVVASARMFRAVPANERAQRLSWLVRECYTMLGRGYIPLRVIADIMKGVPENASSLTEKEWMTVYNAVASYWPAMTGRVEASTTKHLVFRTVPPSAFEALLTGAPAGTTARAGGDAWRFDSKNRFILHKSDCFVDLGSGTGLVSAQVAARFGCSARALEIAHDLVVAALAITATYTEFACPGILSDKRLVFEEADLCSPAACDAAYAAGTVFFMTNTNFGEILPVILETMARCLETRFRQGMVSPQPPVYLFLTESLDGRGRSKKQTEFYGASSSSTNAAHARGNDDGGGVSVISFSHDATSELLSPKNETIHRVLLKRYDGIKAGWGQTGTTSVFLYRITFSEDA